MIVLGVETSCDDTSAAVFDGRFLLSNITSTQLIHRQFGGVVPELASRSHVQLILPVVKSALEEAKIKLDDIEGIAVTFGPGLAGSLLVGLSFAKGLALSRDLPFIGINHLEGHIWGNRLEDEDLKPPFVVLLASGGHTQLIFVKDWGDYEVMGMTRDDASGEAFDKVGKLLDLGYPGGPVIEKLAREGDGSAIRFPRAYLETRSYDFSFSGLKTAVLNYVRDIGESATQESLPNITASFQQAVIDVLVEKTLSAAADRHIDHVCMAGGVAVNQALRDAMIREGGDRGIRVTWPSPALCTDNGGMIALAGHHYLSAGITSPLSLSPHPSLNF